MALGSIFVDILPLHGMAEVAKTFVKRKVLFMIFAILVVGLLG